MNPDIIAFNTIVHSLGKSLPSPLMGVTYTSELSFPWLQSFCFLVDAHYTFLYNNSIFNSDFIFNSESGSFLHKQVSEMILCDRFAIDDYGNRLIYVHDQYNNIIFETLSNKETVAAIDSIIDGLVNSLKCQNNSIGLAELIHAHGDLYDYVTSPVNCTSGIHARDIVKYVEMYYNSNTIKPKSTNNVVPLFK